MRKKIHRDAVRAVLYTYIPIPRYILYFIFPPPLDKSKRYLKSQVSEIDRKNSFTQYYYFIIIYFIRYTQRYTRARFYYAYNIILFKSHIIIKA